MNTKKLAEKVEALPSDGRIWVKRDGAPEWPTDNLTTDDLKALVTRLREAEARVERYEKLLADATEIVRSRHYYLDSWTIRRVEKNQQAWCAYPRNEVVVGEWDDELGHTRATYFTSALEAFESLREVDK